MIALFLVLIISQRSLELMIAKKNERWMKSKGAIELGQSHYPFILWTHILFFVSLLFEVIVYNRTFSPYWLLLLTLFVITQIIRIWSLTSLGRYWNTKVIILPQSNLVKRGPYRYLRHPNYIVVTLEFILIPCILQAYGTAIIFSFLNILILSIRIPIEETALQQLTNNNGLQSHDGNIKELSLKKN